MGTLLTYFSPEAGRSVKRRFQELEDDDGLGADSGQRWSEIMHVPKRRKLTSTMNYIHQTMFREGKGSDVTIIALGRAWKLHKLYLSQSPYFSSMFSDNWRESHQNEIVIQIVDPNITEQGLDTALGSLYNDEVQLVPSRVVEVIAAGSMLQIDSLVSQCCDVMCACVSAQTAVMFLDAARSYALTSVERRCKYWLLTSIMPQFASNYSALSKLSAADMSELVASPQLFVQQTEFSVYALLCSWLFVQLHPSCSLPPVSLACAAQNYFRQQLDQGELPVGWLDSDAFNQLSLPFKALRLEHMILHPLDTRNLLEDGIIPRQWLHSLFDCQWRRLLEVDQATLELGWSRDVTPGRFDACAQRCGRLLISAQKTVWRWTGFNFGQDLVMTHNRRNISLRRNVRQDSSVLVSHAPFCDIVYRLTITSAGTTQSSTTELPMQSTDMVAIQLSRGQEITLLTLDEGATYPVQISFSFMLAPPLTDRLT